MYFLTALQNNEKYHTEVVRSLVSRCDRPLVCAIFFICYSQNNNKLSKPYAT